MLAPSSLKRKRPSKPDIARRKQEDRERLFSNPQIVESPSPSTATAEVDEDEQSSRGLCIARALEFALWHWKFDPESLQIEGEAPETCEP